MSKKILLNIGILIVIVLIGILVLIITKPKVEKPIEILYRKESKITVGDVGYGWSIKDDGSQAAKEAVSMMMEKLKKSPDFAFLFSSVGYKSEKLLEEIKELLPGTKIYGGTSSLGPMTTDGFHIGEKASLAIMGIDRPDIFWGVGGADLDKLDPREAGKEAILAAIENAGKEKTQKPNIVFMTAAPGAEEKILKGIEEIIGKDVPIFGGSSGDNDITGKWRQFANDKVYSNGIAIVAVYTDLKVGYFYEAGYPVAGEGGTITKAEGRVIYEIDGRPAAEVYNEWAGGIFDKQLKEPGKIWGILAESTYYPIAKVLRAPGVEPFYLAVHPLDIRPDRSLGVFADIEKGDEIVFLHGDWEILLNRFRTTPLKALETFKIEKGKGLFALYTYCAGTIFAIPEEERPKTSLLVKEVIGDVPFIGTFTFGEQGFVSEIGNHHGNLVNSIVIFSPK